MAITALQLLAKIGIDAKDAETGIAGLDGIMKAAGGGILVAGAAAATAVVGIGIAAIKSAGDFQAGMTSLVTGAGEAAGPKGIGLVSAGILQLAVDTGTSTEQLTAGMYMIESAGYHGKAGLDILKAAAEGAKVGNADLGTVADATTTILKDYPHVMGGAAGAVNLLVATTAAGKTHMGDLAGALSAVLPAASAAGVGINGIMGALATMTAEGVPAADAATYLRQTIIALDAPGKQAQKTLREFGLSTGEVSAEMQKSLPGAIQMITDAVGKKFPVGSAGYVAALKDIMGGSKQLQGILDLSGVHAGEFAANVKGVGDAVKRGGSQIQGWSDVQKDFNFKIDQAKEVVQTFLIKIGTGLLPVAGQAADFFSKNFVPAIGLVASWFQTHLLPAATQVSGFVQTTVLPIVKTLVGVFVADVLPAVGGVADAFIHGLLPPLERLMAKVLPILNPLLQVVGFILKNVVGPALELTFNLVGKVLDILTTLIDKVTHVGDGFKALGGAMSGAVKGGINGIIGAIDGFIAGVDKIHVNLPGGASLGFNIPQIPYLAEGGDVQQGGVATVGERGQEQVYLPAGARVTPLPAGMASASAAAGAAGGPQTIVVQLVADGKKLAQVVVPHIHTAVRNATGRRDF